MSFSNLPELIRSLSNPDCYDHAASGAGGGNPYFPRPAHRGICLQDQETAGPGLSGFQLLDKRLHAAKKKCA